MSGTGVDISKFVKGLKQAESAKVRAAVRAVGQYGAHVIGDAQQLTPVDTGALQASGTFLDPELKGTTVEQTIGFNTSYAAAVHERLDVAHGGEESKADLKARRAKNKAAGKKTKRRNAVGQAKFLSTAMQQDAPKFGPFVADAVASAGGGGGGG